MKENKFRLAVEEMHPPYWEKKVSFYYFTLDELLVDDYDRKGMPTWFTSPEYYFKECSHGGECLVGKDEYTGLKDKNGKEIYEGDIVVGEEKKAGFPPYDSTEPRVIEFRNGCWCFNAGRYDDGDWIRFGFWTYSNEGKTQLKQLKVIGNIYENPELLEVT